MMGALYLFVKKELQPLVHSPIQGWFGESNPFGFELQYTPASTIKKFLAGTPPVLSLSAIQPGIEILLEAGISNLWKKSLVQTSYLLYLLKEVLSPLGFTSGSPENPNFRGSHIAIKHPEAYRICQALINPVYTSLRIIPDFREPDIIRLGITPLYTSFSDIYKTIYRMKEIITQKEHTHFSGARKKVT